MAVFDSVVVGESWIAEHYLTSDAKSGTFLAQLQKLRAEWDETEAGGHATPRSGLREAATPLARRFGAFGEDPLEAEVRDVHRVVRVALQLGREPREWVSDRSGAEVRLPGAVVHPTPTGTSLLVLEAAPVAAVEELLDPDAGRLLDPAWIDGKPQPGIAAAVSAVFLADDPPPLVLVQAGRWMLLAERTRWPEGRWLAVDLGLVTERRDVRRGGELEHAAAMLGRDLLLPAGDGSPARWLDLLAESVQATVGVSSDLRDGVRLSVEIIANEVVARRAAKGLPVLGEPGLAADLTRQALRYLYRILFLLYAEASPQLQVLPAQAPEYQAGYGLDRLRALTLVELTSERARRGTHLHESLALLFRLVDSGHGTGTGTGEAEEAEATAGAGLVFHALRADLFAARATARIDEVGLGNEALQRVLGHLLLTRSKRGADRGYISYAELGINQLGAVYEGLMSWSGLIAETDTYEVAPGGDPSRGTWLLPAEQAGDVPADAFVRLNDPVTGEPRPVLHPRGSFVYRLASRERQQSASYYTPEVLTRSVVHHALAELLDQDGRTTTAAEVLALTVCEPALGSGAFAIEAVRQLAAEYLRRAQAERGERIPAEDYPGELQRVKAYLALHRVYGVDLNATAVELAEVSLWLDTMQAGLAAPWLGLHLRRGNSLVGARRAVYDPKLLTTKAWLSTPPRDVPLHDPAAPGSLPGVENGIHHFLVPAAGWGSVADTAEAKTYDPDGRAAMRAWRARILAAPGKAERERLARLADRVEVLWGLVRRRLEMAEAGVQRSLPVWGAPPPPAAEAVSREDIEQMLADPDGAYRRLRRVMDAWCAMWSWPLTETGSLPGWQQWLDALEALLGRATRQTAQEKAGQYRFDADLSWRELADAEVLDRQFAHAMPADEALAEHPWLAVAERIADREAYFHWELDFAGVFAHGGFDLQVGNPPWVRPMWNEAGVLAEQDPWWQLTDNPSESAKRDRREHTLALPGAREAFLLERSVQAGASAHLNSAVDRPVLAGLQPDSYRCFMERTWRSTAPTGVVGLIHPESHFTEARAGQLRRETYRRLRRHWQYRNEHKLFSEINDTRTFGVHIYGGIHSVPRFLQASWLYTPETVENSLHHDGSGLEPGIKTTAGKWDASSHAARIVRVDEHVLHRWVALLDEPGTPPGEARMLFPVNQASARVLDKMADAPRLGAIPLDWTAGWHESADRQRGYFTRSPGTPDAWGDVILQGPHLTVATPLFQQPRESAKHQQDYEALDLDRLPADFIPRTTYQRAVPVEQYLAAYPQWDGKPSNTFFRLAWRAMADSATVRSLHAALLPPGPSHVLGIFSLTLRDPVDLVVAAGISSSLAADFLVKVTGVANIKIGVLNKLPHIRHHALEPDLLLRTLRLNCLVQPYARLWEELYDPAWQSDTWVPDIGVDYPARTPLGAVEPTWTRDTPLRRAADRRQALVEIDAIVAVMLGLSADELATVYRTQFPVLQAYERDALYDRTGRQLPADLVKAYRKAHGNGGAPHALTGGERTYVGPFTGVDRENDLRTAYAHFSRLAAGRPAAPTALAAG